MFDQVHPPKKPLIDYYSPLGNSYRGILSIPHSGENIPTDFLPYLSGNQKAYASDVDFKVNELVDIPSLQKAGIAVIISNVHRICVDLNRKEEECVLFWKENTKGEKLVVSEPRGEISERFIETFHRPYFELLKASLQDLEKRKAKKVSMIDLHSMPSAPTEYHLKRNPDQKTERPDFCLSDRRGKTCEKNFINFFSEGLKDAGFSCAQNDPYLGGFITEYVDRFRSNNIQIEINRRIYMDEKKRELLPEKVSHLKKSLTDVLIRGFESFDS